MKLTNAQTKLIDKARLAGYTVEIYAHCVDISKGKGRSLRGLRLYEDGTAHRCDVELGSSTVIRTQKTMKEILGI